ncbi:hypothetical protein FVF58_24000 [Paraburkholderia panacisoli]|uniref:Uncharacterized protein n=1 Tax=Paraburkholderia panacisoli TaxID=2603818 RepID=A0A5B0GXT7_9BURK|nr:hypothetical protein [Paraburkholderia panacisoli]KAA1007776.1 hypothetical protein FVF58_24000 [Paraburkholderia panacisoli]
MSLEAEVVGPTAHCARTMARAQGSGLVKKKQLGVLSWPHERLSAPVFVGKPACYPCSNSPIADDAALPVVKQSTIAHPACGRADRMNVSDGVNSVRQRHLGILNTYEMLFMRGPTHAYQVAG